MITFAAHELRKVAASVCVFSIATAPGAALSQQNLAALAERQGQITADIERIEAEYGPQASELIEPLTALSLFYEEAGDYRLADPTIERLLQVIRANYGLYSLEQVPSIRLLIAHERERGNAAAAWELEQEMLRLAARNADDPRTAEILHEVGDRRIDILRRYDLGEIPPEIELGCYYADTFAYRRAQRRGNQTIHTAPGPRSMNTCAAGSRTRAKQSLTNEAYAFYFGAVEVYERNDLEDSEEFRELLMQMLRTSYEQEAPSYGRTSLRHLMASYPEDAADPLPRIEALIQLADWDLMYSSGAGTNFRDSGLETYEQAYAQLVEHGIPQDTIDALFSPEMPIMLPSFEPNPFVSTATATPTSREYVDVEFVVTREGESTDIEILETTSGVSRSDRKSVETTIKHARFRPIMVDGTRVDSAPVVARWYFTD